ncbi:MAG: alpha/beta hydrolase family protein [Armatimonadota bacterium]
MSSCFRLAVLCVGLSAVVLQRQVQAATETEHGGGEQWTLRWQTAGPTYDVYELTYPSPVTTPWAENNTVHCVYYRVRSPRCCPAVIVLHALREEKAVLELGLCRRLAVHGIHAVLLTLPYHMERTPHGTKSGSMFITADLRATADAVKQAVADVRACVSWLCRRSEVCPSRVGVAGISLGAVLTHLVMGLEPRISAGAAVLGGGDLGAILWDGIAALPVRRELARMGYSRDQLRRELAQVDPLTYADRNRPRRVLMVAAGRDQIIPLNCTLELYRALGTPPITWLNTGHFGIGLMPGRVFRLVADYLSASLEGRAAAVPTRLQLLPVKIGAAYGLNSVMTGCVGVEVYGMLEESPGRPLVHIDLLFAGTGVYAAASATVHRELEVGLAVAVGRGRPRFKPYAVLSFLL